MCNVNYEVVDDSWGAAPTEELEPPLIQLVLDVLTEVTSSVSFERHHHFVDTLPIGGGNQEALLSEHVREDGSWNSGQCCPLSRSEVDMSSENLETLHWHGVCHCGEAWLSGLAGNWNIFITWRDPISIVLILRITVLNAVWRDLYEPAFGPLLGEHFPHMVGPNQHHPPPQGHWHCHPQTHMGLQTQG